MITTRTACILSAICWLFSLIPVHEAHAHRMDVYAYFEGNLLKGEGAYDDGTPADGADIKIYDSKGKLIGTTQTSSDGIFTFTMTPDGNPITIDINDGGGHHAEFVLEDLPTQEEATEAIDVSSQGGGNVAVAEDALAHLLRRELSPIRAELARLANKRQIGISEVFGGLGWIIGIIGAASWFKYKKPQSPSSD